MTKLRISPDLTLPLDAVTQAIGIVAKRRVGKSYTARRFAEQLLKAGQQVVIADPKGDWWGIRSAADGKGPGYPVVILGGEHGDLPLEKGAGEIVAKMVVEERVSVLLDLSQLRKREVAVFMADFLETLYRLKAKESLRTPLMMIIDEADAIAPQKPQDGEERMLGAAEDIVRRGGQRGIGCMMITQRTAVLNKNVLTQCEMLVALRTISPQDLKAMQAWIDVHGSIEERDTLMASLPSLPQGDAWFWSPGWPTSDGIFKRVHVSAIETFDSGATPKSGERRAEPKTVADVDLGALQRQMAATIEKAKADDPKELRKTISAKDKEISDLKKAASRQTIATVSDDERTALRIEGAQLAYADVRTRLGHMGLTLNRIRDAGQKTIESCDDVSDAVKSLVDMATAAPSVSVVRRPVDRTVPSRVPPRGQPILSSREPTEGVSRGEQKLLDAAAKLASVNIETPTRTQVAALAPMSPTSSATERYFATLIKDKGYFEIPSPGSVRLTDAGRAAATLVESPPTLAEYVNEWRRLLGEGSERKLYDAYVAWPKAPGPITRADLAEQADISASSSATERGFAWLIGLELLAKAGTGVVKAGPTMFPEGLE
ncbi:MAG: hypothetical protein JWM41_865 [Gemmatimonadetes bacterium]|nr:hypothetical protein [Gemmatimonadota bacterium]